MFQLSRYCSIILLLFCLHACSSVGNKDANKDAYGQHSESQVASSDEKLESAYKLPLLPVPYKESAERRSVGAIKRGKELNVVLLIPLSGSQSDIGKSMLDAAQMAANDLGAGHINLSAIDSGIDAKSAAAALTKIKDKADIIIGPLMTEQLSVIAPYAKSHETIALTFAEGAEWIGSDGLYLLGIAPLQRLNMLLSYASTQGYTNIYTILPQEPGSDTIEELLLEYQKHQFITDYHVIRYDSHKRDNVFSTAIKSLRDKLAVDNAEGKLPHALLLLPQVGQEFRQLVQQLSVIKDPNLLTIQLAGGSNLDDSKLKTIGWNKDLWFTDPPIESRSELDLRFENIYKYKALPHTLLAYDALALVLTNIESSGKDIVFNPQILLDESGFEGANGVFRFRKDGSNERLLSVFKLQKNGKISEIEIAPTAFKE